LDGTPDGTNGTGTSWSSGATTTSVANDLICGVAMWDGSADTTSTPGSGYTEAQDFGAGNGDNCTLVYSVSNTAGSNTPSGTWAASPSGGWVGASAGYLAAAGGGGGSTTQDLVMPPMR
jgi:hypothetical protein